MKNTKHQTPDTKQISNTKYPRSHEGNGDSTTGWVLHDEAVEREKGKQRHPFDFEERTAMFGEKIVRFAKRIPRGPINDRLISQIVGAGTSIGANFCEANDSVSKKDFRYSAKRCIKEAKETRLFLRMIVTSEPSLTEEARALFREATELIRILATMCK
jgi:four helix bundle protein